ncbi:MAG: dockerin type I domain-containing protein [Gemmatimonadaceae bacterium]
MRTFQLRAHAAGPSLALGAVAAALIATACSRADDTEATQLQREFSDLPTDVAPLFVVGDVNEDGKIDALDKALIARLSSAQRDSSAASCFAAADVTLDGAVDAADAVAFDKLAGDSVRNASLPLYAQPYVACGYRQRFVAAPVEWSHERPLRIYLLQGHTTDRVRLSVRGAAAEAQALPNNNGWEIRVREDLATDALLTITLMVAEVRYSYTMANFSRLAQQIKADAKRWIEAGRTDLDGDGDVDYPDVQPPPTIFGEEIANVRTCPQRGQGCEALVIDFSKKILIDFDADRTKDAMTTVGCNLTYVAPIFLVRPRAYARLTTLADEWIEIPGDPVAVARSDSTNRAGWLQIREAIAQHRANIARGKELVFQLVNGHGDSSASFGSWSPGFAALPGNLSRRDFHQGNYLVTHGKACYAVAEDRSCFSGNTPFLLDQLNNTGEATLQERPSINHGYHAAFWGDMASGTSTVITTCRNGDSGAADSKMGRIIRNSGRNSDFNDLAAVGFRTYILESQNRYNDRGYNRVFGTQCETASHESSY